MKTTMQQPSHSGANGAARRKGKNLPPPGTQGGLTLIEALITLLVMSIGLLGVAAMQVIGIQETASALRHSQATWLAYDMGDRIRANINSVAAANAVADHYNGINVHTGNQPAAADGAACDSAADNCNFATMASFDAFQWWQMIQRLPGGQGTISEPGTGGRYLVRVMWDETTQEIRSDSDNVDVNVQGCPSDMTVTKTCVEIWVEP